MTPQQVRKEVDDYIEKEQAKVDNKAADVLAGTITLAAFFTWMDLRIEAWHKVAGAIAYGGQAQMNKERWARVEERIKAEQEFLAGFKAETTLETVTVEGLSARARMYAEAAYATYENNVSAREQDTGVTMARRICENDEASCDACVEAATEEYLPLGEVADIGTLTCLNNCRCYYEFNYEGIEPLRIDETVNTIFARSEAVQ